MANFYATPEGGNYAVYQQGGGRVATTAAMGLSNYGLSESNLGSATQSAQATPTPPVTPAVTPTPTVQPTATPTPAAPLPTNSGNPSSYLSSLQRAYQTAQSSSQPNYQYLSSLQRAISAEQSRQSGIQTQAQNLINNKSSQTDINNYYAGLSAGDKSLVSSIIPQSSIIQGYTHGNAIVNSTVLGANGLPQGSTGTQTTPAPTTALQPGSTDTANVTALQKYLVANGYMTQAQMDTGPGTYGPQTTAAVQALQQKLGVDNSSGPGYFGPKTIAAINGTQTAPAVTQIGSTVTPPTQSGSPTPTTGTAASVADQFNTSLASTLQAQQAQLAQSLQQQQAQYQTKIDALKTQSDTYQQLQDTGLLSEQSAVNQETAAKQAALQQEQQQFNDNYNARQNLVGQLSTLLTTGQQVIEQMKNTTGLASIMNPRVTQTMTDVQGQAGVITAALAGYDSQIGLAQSQLKSATDAISSIYGDQITYWQNVISFYNTQQKDVQGQITNLTSDQKTYINAQIQQLQDNVTNTQKTAQAIQTAILDPKTALAYAKAGVSLTDTPAQIAQKLGLQAQADANVWSAPYTIGKDTVQKNTVTGEIKSVVSASAAGIGTTPYSFTPTIKTSLAGAGETSASITKLESDIGQYGAQYVLDNGQGLSVATKTVIENEFGIQPTPAAGKKNGLFGLGFLGL